ncbi:MAG: TetR/AcrR family transcriptional regulator [Spirochaetota bacterium]
MPGFREAKKRKRRDRIYDAALELLSEKGYNSTHMRDISARAELAVGTLYNYYSSKADLYMEIMEAKWDEIRAAHLRNIVHLVCTGDDLFGILKGILWPIFRDMYAIGMDDWGELFMAVFSSKKHMARGSHLDLEAIEGFAVLIEKLQKRGIIKTSFEPFTAATSIYSIIAFNVLALLFVEGMNKDYFYHNTEAQLKLMIHGMSAAPEKEGE